MRPPAPWATPLPFLLARNMIITSPVSPSFGEDEKNLCHSYYDRAAPPVPECLSPDDGPSPARINQRLRPT